VSKKRRAKVVCVYRSENGVSFLRVSAKERSCKDEGGGNKHDGLSFESSSWRCEIILIVVIRVGGG
jgi:hypothetical protein